MCVSMCVCVGVCVQSRRGRAVGCVCVCACACACACVLLWPSMFVVFPFESIIYSFHIQILQCFPSKPALSLKQPLLACKFVLLLLKAVSQMQMSFSSHSGCLCVLTHLLLH